MGAVGDSPLKNLRDSMVASIILVDGCLGIKDEVIMTLVSPWMLPLFVVLCDSRFLQGLNLVLVNLGNMDSKIEAKWRSKDTETEDPKESSLTEFGPPLLPSWDWLTFILVEVLGSLGSVARVYDGSCSWTCRVHGLSDITSRLIRESVFFHHCQNSLVISFGREFQDRQRVNDRLNLLSQ